MHLKRRLGFSTVGPFGLIEQMVKLFWLIQLRYMADLEQLIVISKDLTYVHKNIFSVTVQEIDGIKLLFGTKVLNGLVTSSIIRLDTDLVPEVSLTTSRFVVNKQRDINVEIYIEEEEEARGEAK
ncbi:hypothetical protein EDC94DRAFT_644893 [Helicostylum pulchrum]|nr:hypothetical protein EDC94DRAFT_644893 [Helicostylum pulchrum]